MITAHVPRPALRKLRKVLWWVMFYLVVFFLVLFFVFPIIWTFLTSVKTEADAFSMPPKWMFTPTWKNYQTIFTDHPFVRFILNSVLVSAGSTLVAMIVATPASYALSRFRFRGRDQLAFYVLSTRIAPPALVLFPFFLVYQRIGITGSLTGLVVIYLTFTVSLVVWLMQSFFDDIPTDLDEAAMIDGCTRMQAFFRVILPLTRSGLSATAIFAMVMAWNEFLFALILTGVDTKTLPVAITSFIQFTGTRWGELTAAATVVMLPMLVFSFVVQRGLTRGLSMGAIK